MTRNEALELANKFYTNGVSEREVAFARFIAAAEREACAKACEDWTRTPATNGMELTLVAAAIRARGQR